jgi:hypothetical protein
LGFGNFQRRTVCDILAKSYDIFTEKILDCHVRDKAKLAMKLWSQHYSHGFTNARAKNIRILDDILRTKAKQLIYFHMDCNTVQ